MDKTEVLLAPFQGVSEGSFLSHIPAETLSWVLIPPLLPTPGMRHCRSFFGKCCSAPCKEVHCQTRRSLLRSLWELLTYTPKTRHHHTSSLYSFFFFSSSFKAG